MKIILYLFLDEKNIKKLILIFLISFVVPCAAIFRKAIAENFEEKQLEAVVKRVERIW